MGALIPRMTPIPQVILKKETWETYLKDLASELNGLFGGPKPEVVIKRANIRMQGKYPGKYIVEDFYNPKKSKFDLRLRFENSKEELIWKIKWS